MVSDTLDADRYRDAELRDVQVGFGTELTGSTERSVTAVVERPVDARYPELAPTLDRRLTRRLDTPVSVQVTVVPTRRTD